MANSKVVYNDFTPSSEDIAPLAAQYVKEVKASSSTLEKMRLATFAKLVAAKKIDEASKERFRIGYRWAQWAWWIVEEAKASKGKGESL